MLELTRGKFNAAVLEQLFDIAKSDVADREFAGRIAEYIVANYAKAAAKIANYIPTADEDGSQKCAEDVQKEVAAPLKDPANVFSFSANYWRLLLKQDNNAFANGPRNILELNAFLYRKALGLLIRTVWSYLAVQWSTNSLVAARREQLGKIVNELCEFTTKFSVQPYYPHAVLPYIDCKLLQESLMLLHRCDPAAETRLQVAMESAVNFDTYNMPETAFEKELIAYIASKPAELTGRRQVGTFASHGTMILRKNSAVIYRPANSRFVDTGECDAVTRLDRELLHERAQPYVEVDHAEFLRRVQAAAAAGRPFDSTAFFREILGAK